MKNSNSVILCAIAFALAACAPTPTPTLPPIPTPTQTIIPATATNVPLTTTNVPPATARATLTLAPSPTPTRVSTEIPPVAVTLIFNPVSATSETPSTATFTARGNKTEIVLSLKPSDAADAQPAAIYEGACDHLGRSRYSLSNVTAGKSVTTLDVSLPTLLSGVLILDIKKSTRESSASALCILIPEALFFTLDSGKNGNQSGVAVAFQQASGIELDVFIKPGQPGIAQPAFIRDGTCQDLGGIRYSLNHIVDGVSKTFFGVPFSVFRREKSVLNVHRSVQDLDAFVACGAIKTSDDSSDHF